MAFNFSSAQFDRESTPKRLGNWQIPRWAPTRARPAEMRPNPKPICDLNGHFLPGAPRGTSTCFGHYTGTWDLPRKITRKVAAELSKQPPDNRFPDWLNLRVQRPKADAPGTRMRGGKRAKEKKEDKSKPQDEQTYQGSDKNQEISIKGTKVIADENDDTVGKKENSDPLEINVKKEPTDDDGHGPYVPGSLTDPDKRHESHDELVKEAVEQIHGPQEDEAEKFWRKVAENAKEDEQAREDMKCDKKSSTPKLPYVNVSNNFQFAKKMHVGNLEHQPLPDTLGYRNLTKIAEHRDSDIVVKPYAIGWKGYGASGPTCCTKMRVHRPKTCDPKKTEGGKEDTQRPSTSAPNLGAQYKRPMSLMDLAICWDFRPDDAKQEPRPPKHIDGSNGSKAPAVFTMVHTPKETPEDMPISHSNPIFNQNRIVEDDGHHPVPYFEKDITKEKRKDSCEVQYCPQHASANEKNVRSRSSSRRSSAQSVKKQCDGINGCGTPSDTPHKPRCDARPDKLHPVKDAWNVPSSKNNAAYDLNRNRHSLESYEKTPLAQGKVQHSSPNESLSRHSKETASSNTHIKHKNCLPCNVPKSPSEAKHKEDYKFAFKAGNPNSVQSVSSNDSKGIKMPKMRHPYTKKSYTIPTLTPPFTIWRDANATGYPEHWRLASVYQHAYKPPEQRRRPLIESVYQ